MKHYHTSNQSPKFLQNPFRDEPFAAPTQSPTVRRETVADVSSPPCAPLPTNNSVLHPRDPTHVLRNVGN